VAIKQVRGTQLSPNQFGESEWPDTNARTHGVGYGKGKSRGQGRARSVAKSKTRVKKA
jgi:hypothetical protein